MTRLNSLLLKPTQCNAATVREVVGEDQTTQTALAMQALYKECVAQLIDDPAMTFHVVMMPAMTGHHYTYMLRDEPEFAFDCARLLNTDIHKNDCFVILGHDILSQEISEDAMMRIVLSDIALHLRRLFPITDEATGWRGDNIGWAAIASVIAAAHPIIRTFQGQVFGQDEHDIPAITFHEEIANRALRAVKEDYRSNPELEWDNHRRTRELIERVCDIAVENNGGYLSLPASVSEIHAVACEHFHEARNNMGFALHIVA